MFATVWHCILVTPSLVILFGTAYESSSSLHTTTTSMVVAQGLSGPTYVHSCHNHCSCMCGNKLFKDPAYKDGGTSIHSFWCVRAFVEVLMDWVEAPCTIAVDVLFVIRGCTNRTLIFDLRYHKEGA